MDLTVWKSLEDDNVETKTDKTEALTNYRNNFNIIWTVLCQITKF